MAIEIGQQIAPPAWSDVAAQPCMKYCTVERAMSLSVPWVQRTVQRMIEGMTDPLIDVRFWPWLKPGQIPGVPGWHYDVFNTSEPRPDEHRLYFIGAGCRPMFRPNLRPPEGVIVHYRHADQHQIMPAEMAGPRLLIRCTTTTIRAANHVYQQAHIAPTWGP